MTGGAALCHCQLCAVAGIDKAKVLLDHREVSFGEVYGVLIKEMRLLVRAIIIVDAKDTLRYVEIVSEVTDAPDYEAALVALDAL